MALIDSQVYLAWKDNLIASLKSKYLAGAVEAAILLPREPVYYGDVDFCCDSADRIEYAVIDLKKFTVHQFPQHIKDADSIRADIKKILDQFQAEIMETERAIEFQRGPAGEYYGYKVLVKVKEDPYYRSPNYINLGVALFGRVDTDFFRWKGGRLSAHSEPEYGYGFHGGIHGTKELKDVMVWFRRYTHDFPAGLMYDLVIVKLVLWGTIVETTKGFRAQHARIEEVI